MARTRYAVRGLAVVGAATLVVGLAMPAVAAPGAGVRAAAQAAAMDLPEATGEEKEKALAAIGVVPDGEWLILPDRSFVSRLLTDPKSAPLTEVRAAAQAALNTEGTDAATLFIRSEIFGAVDKDESRIRQEQLAKQQAREAKQRALAYLEIPATPELLDLPDDQFIRRVGALMTQPWSTRVQAGVNTALRGEAPVWKAFIETGVIAAHRADVEADIQAQKDKTEAEKEALRQQDLKRRAASVVAWAPTAGELTLSSDNFIRKIEEKAVAGSEVAAAALAALRSPEPTVWAAFIETGIYAADARDKKIALDKKAAADRKLALELQTKAEKTLVRPALVAAAKAALAGSDADVDLFLRVGQFTALTQSISTTTPKRKGWWLRSAAGDASLTSGDSAGAPSAPIADVTWKVTEGLGDQDCFSFESKDKPGHYLRPTGFRVQLLPSDGGTEFKNAATWCAKKGLTGSGVSLESKSQPGRYLRHLGTELWAAKKGGQAAYDRSCGYTENATWLIDAPDPKTAPKPAPVKDPCSDVAAFYDYSNNDTGLWLLDGLGEGGVTGNLAWRSGGGQWDVNRAKPVSGDFNGDGKLDIAAFYSYPNDQTKLWIFDDVKGGRVKSRVAWDSGVHNWGWGRGTPLAGDFNGDGKTDIASFYDYSNSDAAIFLFDGLGGGTVSVKSMWRSGPGGWDVGRAKPVAGDFNGDGKAELGAFYSYPTDQTKLWLFNNIAGPTVTQRTAWDSGIHNWGWGRGTPVAGDFNGDGKAEIASFYDYSNSNASIFLFDGLGGGSTSVKSVWSAGAGQWDMSRAKPVAGDFNGDGKTDVGAFYSYPNAKTRFWAFDNVAGSAVTTRLAWDSGEGNWDWGRNRPVG